MRSQNIHHLLESDHSAKEYFDNLPNSLREALLAHGNGINTMEELKHFAVIMDTYGGRPFTM